MTLYISKQNIKTIINDNNIIKIISKYLKIKKIGNNYKTLCPFHKEKTESFFISQKKQKYYCFGCQKNGNVINFLMEYNKISFLDAINILSHNKYKKLNDNVEIYNFNNILNEISEIYHQNIKNKTEELNSFLIKRDIDDNLIQKFKLGFVQNTWNFLFNILKKRKNLTQGISLGLVIQNNNKYYDRFRYRLIFPIRNIYGETIGFGGRSLNEKNKPKYINSTESILFSKKKELYGIFESNIKNFKKKISIIVVEGYIDVLALHKNNIFNVVSSLGTSFSIDHIKNLKKFCNKIIFCFDGDNAGKKASLKTAYLCLPYIESNFFFEFILLPDTEDPDSYIKKYGKKEFLKLIDKPIYVLDYIYDNMTKSLDIKFFNNKIYILKKFKDILKNINNIDSKKIIINYIKGKFFKKNNKNLEDKLPLELKFLIILLIYKKLIFEIKLNKLIIKSKINTNLELKFLIECFFLLKKNINLDSKIIYKKILTKFNYDLTFYLSYLKNLSKIKIIKEFNILLKKIYAFEKI